MIILLFLLLELRKHWNQNEDNNDPQSAQILEFCSSIPKISKDHLMLLKYIYIYICQG